MVASSDRDAVAFSLSPGNAHDAPEGRKLLEQIGEAQHTTSLVMDRAYESDINQQLAYDLFYTPVVPPKCNRKDPWVYDKQLYKLRNQIERLFRRMKRFRRVFTRYDKLDVVFCGFIFFALIVDSLAYVNRA